MPNTPMPNKDALQHADLDWDENGQPQSRQYGDVYFSRLSGQEETRHVFLAQNHLAERFSALLPGQRLAIGETGFGTGLNFLCAWQLFEEQAPAGARLHFISVEKHPLTPQDMARALALWPTLSPFAKPLLEQYSAVHPGFQHFILGHGRVTLTLLIGDVLDSLPQLDARIDAWFLDGFSPAKNPQMWQPELFRQLARLSSQGATLGTFTSAGFVRRGLIEAGFSMQRVAGFGHKREILQGCFDGIQNTSYKPWYARPEHKQAERHAIVIGAGLAGCSTAFSLARRGWRVTLIERHEEIAQEASGNPQGVLYLKLSAHGTALSRLVVSGFGYTRRLLHNLRRGEDWQDCGVLQLGFDAKESARQQELARHFPASLLQLIDQETAERRCGMRLGSGGLFFPEAGWVHPPALCQWLAGYPGIEQLMHHQALQLQRLDGEWQVLEHGAIIAQAPLVVLAGAADCAHFSQTDWLPLKRIRGQITRLPANAASSELQCVVCAEGYVAPGRSGEHTLGASFNFQRHDSEPSQEEHASNLAMLEEISGDLHRRLTPSLDGLEGRASLRCTSPDYMPLVGPLANAEAFAHVYANLARNARHTPEHPCPWHQGLYINTAHGSRGLISAPLSGELLAAWIDDEPLPLPRDIAEACHPNRYLLRSLIRRTT
ncbi:bifunctional tRNA (5-methylaminomethyl-2-thiouridine)(34)-methyltransferase MnmD/FAD-dependent 5-carboxymethylaminomethyl-2-thiouridine(34) oxidoreductase MnmC [Stutzerimonas kirkiae]|uniref:tRNA 5-methylaminomethyl-2-thiouridine biosynthesis bifunctional protein MnmC n=1 Tax=Stutzerimonas kirkiae TaxID=2211392 RepID=A0A4Q9QVJ9_9GAMM|nr:bifunctional tRNA (5-methylaminomethyl-2-thiouridine)(34)-methyltransferase MnmD/FAD-dependent 5-carboxymethylaminomethyl-2-thiouridine(34) oxidoreductase MnmC [Stutzerimonas kirkiae]TBU87621.1 bifunctional tRNA (5-methylaminomethyl-2-thiouridine)(34)-methyltransferase MnmD/FAD-dependent 5-carboxymethylaminomethyl-2-thiouridine(34) oxidoreductase MnmC [Stutzerimonas kirkiae]TBU98013.1 bifunctional tRNA (5-methylaminomethyl-2-thiouridine)(34)-methyltransferase MnmD/FAD-dependent 5-carboxymethyl